MCVCRVSRLVMFTLTNLCASTGALAWTDIRDGTKTYTGCVFIYKYVNSNIVLYAYVVLVLLLSISFLLYIAVVFFTSNLIVLECTSIISGGKSQWRLRFSNRPTNFNSSVYDVYNYFRTLVTKGGIQIMIEIVCNCGLLQS